MKYVLYGHGGSGNHGCEAIVRTTLNMIKKDADIEVYTCDLAKDRKFGVDGLASFHQYRGKSCFPPSYYGSKALYKFLGNYDAINRFELKEALKCRNSVCLSIGGDNYCNAEPRRHASRNKLFSRDNRTVLWGCSVTPELLQDPFYVKDMKRYSLITARESVTFHALQLAGIEHAVLASDPAFTLETEEVVLPELFKKRRVVGINISPLVMKYEQGENILLKNMVNLIQFIFKETDYGIALIPHVLLKNNNDLTPLKILYDEYKDSGRICLVNGNDNMNCRQLKYAISKCVFMVVARTHASIAAYSTSVPTLVLGYSVKSKGIATDIFGSQEHYVLPVDKISSEGEVRDAFIWIVDHADMIRERYQGIMPGYIKKAYLGADALNKVKEIR